MNSYYLLKVFNGSYISHEVSVSKCVNIKKRVFVRVYNVDSIYDGEKTYNKAIYATS
jgi:hypothetical protein